jgi:CpeT protein
MRFLSLFVIILMISNSIYCQKKITQRDLYNVYHFMVGSYSSEIQSIEDTSYFDIRLKMVPLWSHLPSYWLYVEQAMAEKEDKPYRQRVYQLSILNDSTIESKVFIIKNGEKYFGDWQYIDPLNSLTPDSLEERKGCSIYLHKDANNQFHGSTHNTDCESSLKGATYATSSVQLFSTKIISWDRGFDKNDVQVWGAKKGGYIFHKINK